MNANECIPRTDWIELAREVLQVEIEGLNTVSSKLDAAFVDALALMAECTGRVVICGVGKSGLVGRKIAATLSSTGTPSFFMHPVEGAHGDMGMLRDEDVVLAISNSGETAELNAILPSLRSIGTAIISMTGNPQSNMAKQSDVVLNTSVPREACTLDLAPTASTTATLALGDALAVCLINWKSFTADDFKKFHPGGALGQRLSCKTSELMHTESLPATSDASSLGSALHVLDEGAIGTVALTDGSKRLTGILTDGDLRRIICTGEFSVDRPVFEVMTRTPRFATPNQPAAEVLDLMEAKAITVLPIVDEEHRLIGMIHLHDLLGKGGIKFAG